MEEFVRLLTGSTNVIAPEQTIMGLSVKQVQNRNMLCAVEFSIAQKQKHST